MRHVALRAGRFAGHHAVRALLAASALVLLVIGLGPMTGAYRTVTVLSGSMGPGMPVGAVAFLVPVNPAAVEVGDVITFQAPIADHPVVTHRVVEILEGGAHPVVRTKGDANVSADPWTARIENSPAWRRVAVIPYAGTMIRALRSDAVHHATVHVVPGLLLAVLLVAIWTPGPKASDGSRA
jgi:signal peptidase